MGIVVSEVDPPLASRIVSSVMGSGHGYWARLGEERGVGLVAWLDGTPAGAAVYYMPVEGLAVVYYVAVAPGARGRRLGSVLVSSVEEHSGAEGFLATIASNNNASLRMFSSLGYETGIIDVDRDSNAIMKVACADDDTFYAGKGRWRQYSRRAAKIHGWRLCTPPTAYRRSNDRVREGVEAWMLL